MTMFLLATLGASLVGSLHCAGMCGPFVLIATGTERRAQRLALYHIGRLITYASLGAIAGTAGSMVDLAGSAMGLQRLAAYAVGGSLVAWGAVLAVRAAGFALPLFEAPRFIGRFVQSGFRFVKHWPRSLHAASIGLLSGFLPCGWLYLFVLAAAGTETAFQGASVMLAFWIGTLPILTALTAGASKLSLRYHKLLPAATAIVCLLAGGHTLWARARSDFEGLGSPASVRTTQDLSDLTHQPLPCCRHAH